MTDQILQHPPCRQIPDLDLSAYRELASGRDKVSAVRAKGQAPDRERVPAEGHNFTTRIGIPDVDLAGPVLRAAAGRGQSAAVGAIGQCESPGLWTDQLQPLTACGGLEDPDRTVKVSHGQPRAVGPEVQMTDSARTELEGSRLAPAPADALEEGDPGPGESTGREPPPAWAQCNRIGPLRLGG